MPDSEIQTLSQRDVILKPRRALPFFSRHPWVFAGAIDRVLVDGQRVHPDAVDAGSEVTLMSSSREFVARGLYNPHSNLRVRLYSWNPERPIDADLLAQRINEAINLRRAQFGEFTRENACRLIFSESDGLSGLTVDRYGDWLLVQFTSLALYHFAETIVRQLELRLRPRGIYARTDRGIGESEKLEFTDGLLAGEEPPRPMFIEERGTRFGVDVATGQKTGFYLDQSSNRRAVAGYVTSHRVLDVFCYTGAFGITAIRNGGASSCVGIDSSTTALETARANAELNEVATQCRFEKADAKKRLHELARAGEKFDTVILDPPKMARNRAGVRRALKGYFHLNRSAVDLLPPGGLLVTCSCSGLISRIEFQQMLASVTRESNRTIRMLEDRGQAPDHPVSVNCLETGYLKCLICRVA